MDHCIATRDDALEQRMIADVAPDLFQIGVVFNCVQDIVPVQIQVEYPNAVARREKFWDQNGPNIPCTTSNKNSLHV